MVWFTHLWPIYLTLQDVPPLLRNAKQHDETCLQACALQFRESLTELAQTEILDLMKTKRVESMKA